MEREGSLDVFSLVQRMWVIGHVTRVSYFIFMVFIGWQCSSHVEVIASSSRKFSLVSLEVLYISFIIGGRREDPETF